MKARDLAHYIVHKVDTGSDFASLLKNLEAYLEKVNRLDLYPLTLGYVKTILNQKASRDTVRIVSPFEIKGATTKGIVEKLTDEKVTHTEKIDDSMIGGFEAEYKDRKVGINFKQNLDAFKKHLTT